MAGSTRMTRRTSLALGLAALGGAGLAYVRYVPMDPEHWHADPEDGARTGNPNDHLMGPGGDRAPLIFDLPPAEVMARLDVAAMVEPGVERLAGDVGAGHVTYVQRTRLMGYPDAISVKASPEGAGTRLSIWSRSRFGKSDFGVNRERVERWLAAAGLEGGV